MILPDAARSFIAFCIVRGASSNVTLLSLAQTNIVDAIKNIDARVVVLIFMLASTLLSFPYRNLTLKEKSIRRSNLRALCGRRHVQVIAESTLSFDSSVTPSLCELFAQMGNR